MSFDPNKKTLVIVESPTKANTIKKYLPKNYTVVASKGHIRDLPQDALGVDIDNSFKPEYVISKDKEELVLDLKKKLSKSEQLLLATDEDREGESISWHLNELLKPKVLTRRMVFHEITKKAVSEALEKGREIDLKLVKAQEDRRIIDRLYGYEISPVLWKRLSNKKLSAGRVQSVGLRFLVDKENERFNHNASKYFDIKVDLKAKDNALLAATLEEYDGERVATSKDFDSITGEFNNKALLLNSELCDEVISQCRVNQFEIESVIQKNSKSKALAPFTTSTLQMVANRRLRMSSKETMRVAQALFENGFITYMRTDSVSLSDECISLAREQILKEYGKEYLLPNVRRFENKSKNAQEAHEAIRPAGDYFRSPQATGLQGKELSLYTLIYQRTLATQMSDATKSTTTIKISSGKARFTLSGTQILFPGYLKVYNADSDDESEETKLLPSVTAGDLLELVDIKANEHVTQPSQRYSEATLIKKLEEKGIGRPSTYATIISTLLDRGYVVEKDRALIPTFMGFAVNNFMLSSFKELVDYSYTSEMEDILDKISVGESDNIKYLTDFYYGSGKTSGLKALVESAKNARFDVKTLSFPHLNGSVELSNEIVSYQIKVGPFGSYLLLDKKREDGKAYMINLSDAMCPGCITNDDIALLISSEILPKASLDANVTVLKSSNRGSYWQRGDKTCNVPKGRKAAESYTEEEIDFYFSLPKAICQDEDGNDLIINNGPYGGYITYKGSNYKVFGQLTELTAEKALSLVKRDNASSKGVEYTPIDSKAVSLKKGRFGSYLKWGSVNVALTKDEKARSGELTQTDVEEIIKRYKESEKAQEAPASRGEYNGNPIEILKGRFGYYIKCNGKNYRMSKAQQEKLDSITLEELIEIIKQNEERNEALIDFGLYENVSLKVLKGRFGPYLKYGEYNIAIPAKLSKDLDSFTLDDAIALVKKKLEKEENK